MLLPLRLALAVALPVTELPVAPLVTEPEANEADDAVVDETCGGTAIEVEGGWRKALGVLAFRQSGKESRLSLLRASQMLRRLS